MLRFCNIRRKLRRESCPSQSIHTMTVTRFANSINEAVLIRISDWRDVPLLTAISFGVASVEADVFFINGTLFVGHEEAALSPDRTFSSLYVQPLLEILRQTNPKNEFTVNQTRPKYDV